MDFLGIGIGEILLISTIGFIVLGPERLQSAARALGRSVAQLMAWQQQSPEVQKIYQVRRDFEREISELKNEMLRTRQQLDVSEEMRQLRQDTSNMLSDKDTRSGLRKATKAAPSRAKALAGQAKAASAPLTEDEFLARLLEEEAGQQQTTAPLLQHPLEEKRSVARKTSVTAANGKRHKAVNPDQAEVGPEQDEDDPAPPPANGKAHASAPDQPANSILPVSEVILSEQERLAQQLHTLIVDMQALQARLRERGLLEPDWLPPSEAAQQEAPPS